MATITNEGLSDLIAKYKNVPVTDDNISVYVALKELSRYKQAEDEGRLVVLLDIKYNKIMYWLIDNQTATVLYKGKPWGNVLSSEKIFKVYYNIAVKKDIVLSSGYIIKQGDKRCFERGDIGKTVFLTREQAEQAGGLK